MPDVFSRPTAEVAEEPEDLVNLKDMEARHVQNWCLMQIDQCRSRISALRSLRDLDPEVQGIPEIEDGSPRVQNSALQGGVDSPGGTAISRIQECKARIRALRSLYNSAAPINHAFPVELIMEIFTYLQPTDFNRRHGAYILRVCRLWTDVLYNTPQFWANVLALYHDSRCLCEVWPQRLLSSCGLMRTGSRSCTSTLRSASRGWTSYWGKKCPC